MVIFQRWLVPFAAVSCVLIAAPGALAGPPTTAPSGDLNADGEVSLTDLQCMILVHRELVLAAPLTEDTCAEDVDCGEGLWCGWLPSGVAVCLPGCLDAGVSVGESGAVSCTDGNANTELCLGTVQKRNVDMNCDGDIDNVDVQFQVGLLLSVVGGPGTADVDGDGLLNGCDPDSDGDGADDGADCAPLDPTIAPDAPEVCDGEDDNCSGLTDGDDPALVLPDCEVQEGACLGAQKPPILCAGQAGWAACDADAYLAHSANYEAIEDSCDGVDNDCDGLTDNDDPDIAVPCLPLAAVVAAPVSVAVAGFDAPFAVRPVGAVATAPVPAMAHRFDAPFAPRPISASVAPPVVTTAGRFALPFAPPAVAGPVAPPVTAAVDRFDLPFAIRPIAGSLASPVGGLATRFDPPWEARPVAALGSTPVAVVALHFDVPFVPQPVGAIVASPVGGLAARFDVPFTIRPVGAITSSPTGVAADRFDVPFDFEPISAVTCAPVPATASGFDPPFDVPPVAAVTAAPVPAVAGRFDLPFAPRPLAAIASSPVTGVAVGFDPPFDVRPVSAIISSPVTGVAAGFDPPFDARPVAAIAASPVGGVAAGFDLPFQARPVAAIATSPVSGVAAGFDPPFTVRPISATASVPVALSTLPRITHTVPATLAAGEPAPALELVGVLLDGSTAVELWHGGAPHSGMAILEAITAPDGLTMSLSLAISPGAPSGEWVVVLIAPHGTSETTNNGGNSLWLTP